MTNTPISAETMFEMCTAGDFESIRELLQNPAYIAKAIETEERAVDENSQHTLPLLNLSVMFNKAAAAGSAEIVEYLLSFANAQGIPYEALIHRLSVFPAISSRNSVAVFEKFVAVKPDTVDMYMSHNGTPLSLAIGRNRYSPRSISERASFVRFLLENGANPDRIPSPYYCGSRLYLEDAARQSSLEVIELFLQHGAQLEQSRAMHGAAERGRIDVMDLLLKRGADVNEQLGETDPMYSSNWRTKVKKKESILSDVSDDRTPKWTHETPLHFSVLYRKVEATAWLVEHGADPGITDSKGWSARSMAIKMGDVGILEALGIPAEMTE